MTVWNNSASSAALYTGATAPANMAAGAGKFVCPGFSNTGIISADGGVTWANIAGLTAGFSFAAFGAGLFVSCGPNFGNQIISYQTSVDGVTWTPRTVDCDVVLGITINIFHGVFNLKFVNGAFYIFFGTDTGGNTISCIKSVDGINWTDALGGVFITAFGANKIDLSFGAGVYVIQVASDVYVGASLASLTNHTIFPDPFTNRASIAFGGGKFVTVCDDNDLLFTSTDGTTWTSAFVPPDTVLHQSQPLVIFFAVGRFYLSVSDSVGNLRLYSSSDAITWTEETIPSPPDTAPGAHVYAVRMFATDGADIVGIGSTDFFGVEGAAIYASLGPPPVTVPDVRGDTLPTAVSILTGAGFTIGTVTIQDSSTVAVDIVFVQSPVGIVEPAGTPINLTISTGPARIISKLTQKLLLYLHRVFDKDPHPVLSFRVRYDGVGLTWSIFNGVMTLTATGGSGTSHAFNIANFSIGQLAQFIAALPGYSIPYQDTSAYALLSALALLDSNGNMNVSNGDHVFGYTNLLWSWMDSNSSELGTAKAEIDSALEQMSTTTAQDEWLDYQGSFYNVPRLQSELDPNYSPRMIASVLQPRGNNVAIASAIKSIAVGSQTVLVIDAINDTGFAITYNGLIHFDGSEFYDAGLGVNGAYGFFDVDFSFDFTGPVSQSTYYQQILTTVEAFRDAGTQLRAVIFRNNGSTTTIVSDSFVGRVRVIIYDDFTGASFRLLENGLVRFTETGDARILES